VMFGGADPAIPNLIPSDIEIRRNYFFKPLAWRASGAWTVKNLLELKLGRRVLIQGNIFENSWAAAQAGFAIVIWSVNQGGGALVTLVSGTTQQCECRDNIAARAAYGIHADDAAEGVPALNLHTPGWLFASNLVIAAPTASYPPGNSYPASASAVGFVNYGGG